MGSPLNMGRRLAVQAEMLERLGKGPAVTARGRSLARVKRDPMANVVTLRSEPLALPAPDHAPRPLLMSTADLTAGEMDVNAAMNAAMLAGIRRMHAILVDPAASDAKAVRTFDSLLKAATLTGKARMRAQREASAALDLQEASEAERSAFNRRREAERLVADGYEVITPAGRKVRMRERREPMAPDGDDTSTPMACDLSPAQRRARAAAAKTAPFVPQPAVDHSPEARARRDAEMMAELVEAATRAERDA
jgi:hypothetical protein